LVDFQNLPNDYYLVGYKNQPLTFGCQIHDTFFFVPSFGLPNPWHGKFWPQTNQAPNAHFVPDSISRSNKELQFCA
jgi:hypothetical protein